MNVEDIRKQLKYEQEKEKRALAANLPIDFSLVLRKDAQDWLEKYGVTDGERFKYKIGWSEIYESLVFPAFDGFGNLLLVQRRYFGRESFPKYHTKGFPESVVWTTRPTDLPMGDPRLPYNGVIVLVEDFISAIKVGRQFECSPLWGSNVSLGQIKRLSDRWKEVVFWLDFNKTKEAMKYRLKALPYFEAVWVVSTEKDPKDYNDGEIAAFTDYLNEA